MKILFAITSTALGGAEHILYDLALSLSKKHTVKVVSLNPAGYYGAELEKKGVRVTSLNINKRKFFKDLSALNKEILAFKPDVVHAFLPRAIQMCRMLKTPDFKLFTTPHTDYSKLPKMFRILDAALKMKDTLSLAESKTTAEFLLINQRYNKDKVKTLPNCAAAGFAPDENLRKKTRAAMNAQDKTIFINVARLSPEKNQAALLNAFAKLLKKRENIALWLAGEGPERKNLEDLAAVLGIQNHVQFLGQRSDINALLNAADIFVLPSITESRPLALLEARAAGKPLIASNAGDNAEICLHGQNGFIYNTQDPVMLSALMSELLDNKELRERFAKFSLSNPSGAGDDYCKAHEEIYKL